MAKLDSKDPRWIVEERQDGRNVSNWHWAEKDVSQWAKRRLSELLGNLKLSSQNGGLQASTSEEVEVIGDAVINNRKKKLIPAYELEIKGTWSGHLGADKVEGSWNVPYLAEENAGEDPELRISTSTESEVQRKAKTVLLATGKQVLLDRLRQFVKEIAAGGPAANNNGSHESALSKPQSGTARDFLQPTQQSAVNNSSRKSSSKSSGTRSFKTVEKFYARPRDIYECFTVSQRIQAYTQSPAKVEPKEGGLFEIFGGSVIGKFELLRPDAEIRLQWRFRNWEETSVSTVHITLEEPEEGTTVLKLSHTGIPEEDSFGNSDVLDTTTAGWKQQIFHRIRAVFGYGLGL